MKIITMSTLNQDQAAIFKPAKATLANITNQVMNIAHNAGASKKLNQKQETKYNQPNTLSIKEPKQTNKPIEAKVTNSSQAIAPNILSIKEPKQTNKLIEVKVTNSNKTIAPNTLSIKEPKQTNKLIEVKVTSSNKTIDVKKEAYNAAKRIKPRGAICLGGTRRTKGINEPYYDDVEIGFGKKWFVKDSIGDDDHATPKDLIKCTKASVCKQLNDILSEIDSKKEEFNAKIRNYVIHRKRSTN